MKYVVRETESGYEPYMEDFATRAEAQARMAELYNETIGSKSIKKKGLNENSALVVTNDGIVIVWEIVEEPEEADYTCYEVETYYKSGRKRTDIITAINEEKMWEIYDRQHNASLIDNMAIVDSWCQ